MKRFEYLKMTRLVKLNVRGRGSKEIWDRDIINVSYE